MFYTTWNYRQLPDGTTIWTSPTGRAYTTKPHGALFFPQRSIPTRELILPNTPTPTTPTQGLAMPTRRRTRAQDRAYRVEAERRSNPHPMRRIPPTLLGVKNSK